MFVGHYAAAFAARTSSKAPPLWVLFIAAQFVDVVWDVLVMGGLEKLTITPGMAGPLALDLYYMPWTHSLVSAVVWSALILVAYRFLSPRSGLAAALLVAAVVASHWVLDLVVHVPDMPLYDNTLKQGLALWRYPKTAFVGELALLLGSMLAYWRFNQPRLGKARLAVLTAVMVIVQAIMSFTPPLAPEWKLAAAAFGVYVIFTAGAYWLEREPAPNSRATA